MPVTMTCQINNQKSQIFPNTNLDRLGKTGRYLQLRSFTFLHCIISKFGPFQTLRADGCPKVVILAKHYNWPKVVIFVQLPLL